MFGYVKTDYPYLYIKDDILYKSLYCGVCKSIGKTCNQVARLTLNYDFTFLNLFVHAVLGKDITLKKQHCIVHPIRKKSMALTDELSDKVAILNVLMAYYKLNDDVLDNRKGRLKRSVFKSAYKKAKNKEPQLDKIVSDNYSVLLEYEKKNGDSIDIAADSFGNMLREILKNLTKEKFTFEIGELGYMLGKWIYLIDALDDYDKDIKSGNYNVFYNAYKTENKKMLLDKFANDIGFTYKSVLSNVADYGQKIKYEFNHDLIDNILYRGLAKKTAEIMGEK